MPKFTTQKKMFCDNILSGMRGMPAAIKAGYSPNGVGSRASQLLNDPDVMQYIEAAEARSLAKAEITAEWILNKTKETLLKAEMEGDHKNVFKGLEMLGKNKKLWVDVQEHKFDVQQMGRVMIADDSAINGEAVELEFNVGSEPNAIDHKTN